MDEEMDVSMVCRICLQSAQKDMTSLLENDGTYCIYEKIEKCANLKIYDEPDMPMQICSKCKVFLSFAFKFYIMCQNSQNYLVEFGLKSNKEAIVENNKTEIDETAQLMEFPITDETQDEYLDDEKLWIQTEDDQIIELEESEFMQLVENESTTVESFEKVERLKKTLDISSDGAAVIREKKSVNNKKQQVHVCEICGNVYHKRYLMETHMRHHRNEKPYECEICGGKYTYNFQLRRHMNRHTGKRPFSCGYCGRTFTDNSTMRKHERLHRNERPYKCDVCEKTFTYSSVLKAHQQTHTGEKPYVCGICNKRFSRGHHLRAHLETQLHAKDPRVQYFLQHIRPDEDSVAVIENTLNEELHPIPKQ